LINITLKIEELRMPVGNISYPSSAAAVVFGVHLSARKFVGLTGIKINPTQCITSLLMGEVKGALHQAEQKL
jgi:hypothetical protein